MAINKKLIHFRSKQKFNEELANGNILDTSIVFILDTTEIYTHGSLYKTMNWSILEPFNGHEYVDLGLPSGTLWAKCNVGAEKESDYGLYFAWGETVGYNSSQVGYGEGKKYFDWSDYKHVSGDMCDGGEMSKYNPGLDNLTTLLPEDDAASVNMRGSWRMPSKEQFGELYNSSYTTTTWTTVNGINGRLITSKINNNTLFLPASGHCVWGSVYNVGSSGHYWSSSLDEGSTDAVTLEFNSDYFHVRDYMRYQGYTVRGVINLNKATTATVIGDVLEVYNASYKNEILEIKGAKVDNETLIFNK